VVDVRGVFSHRRCLLLVFNISPARGTLVGSAGDNWHECGRRLSENAGDGNRAMTPDRFALIPWWPILLALVLLGGLVVGAWLAGRSLRKMERDDEHFYDGK
jgi:hypothetical protein